MLTEIIFIVGLGITNPPQIKDRSELWHARFYDRAAGEFYCGNGATAWEAIAWALDERAHRQAGHVRMAVSPTAKPTLDVVPAAKREYAPEVITKEAVRLPIAGVCSPETKQKTAAARRARSKKGAARGDV